MKNAQLPRLRVEASVRKEIERVLHKGESLSESVETAAVDAARRRKAQEEFLTRGRASMAKAKLSGEFYTASEALSDMRIRLHERMEVRRSAKGTTGTER